MKIAKFVSPVMLMNIAIVGTSPDRRKFGNIAVRAFLKRGHRVFPVNLKNTSIEGIPFYKSLDAIQESLDWISIYLPPSLTEKILEEIARLRTLPKSIYINPGAE
ncbi:CoA-binding protein [Candidatus Micrarchaeota archaeon]|nr:CoA-binding protein [Candidatus Micrarchaeota archaeon]